MRYFALFTLLFTCACASMGAGSGQVIYHWEKQRTGIEKFSRDHIECLRLSEPYSFLPDIKSWFYTEEAQYNLRADWHSKTGIWASYIQYPGAQPVLVNSLRKDDKISPQKYRVCMENRGYRHRAHNIPEVTNVFVYRPQRILEYKPTIEEKSF